MNCMKLAGFFIYATTKNRILKGRAYKCGNEYFIDTLREFIKAHNEDKLSQLYE